MEWLSANVIAFVSINKFVDSVYEIFNEKGKQLELVLFTNNGKEDEVIQGILTPWDFIGNVQ